MRDGQKTRRAALSLIISRAAICLALLALLLALFATWCRARGENPFLFGHAVLFVATESMEPTIPRRSAILVRESDGEGLAVGDVITYVCRDETSAVYGKTVTHRITAVNADGTYRTKGDHPAAVADRLPVRPEDVRAVYVCALPVFSWFSSLFSGPLGLVFIAVMFVLLLATCVVPEIMRAVSPPQKEEEYDAAFARRVEEEVRRLQDEEENNKGTRP